jgi:hypothetical protein
MSATPTFTGVVDNEHFLLRVRRFYRYRRAILSLLSDINSVLVAEHATGTLVVHYSQGSASVCEFREESGLSEPS